MKTLKKLLAPVVAFCALTCAANNNDLVVKQMKVNSFDAIEAECVDVYVSIGAPQNTFTVTGSPEILSKFSATESDGTLKLSCVKKNSRKGNPLSGAFKGDKKPVVKITVSSLSEIKAGLCSRIIVDSPMNVSQMNLTCETSSLVKIPAITAKEGVKMHVGLSSSVDVKKLSAKAVDILSETSSLADMGSLIADVTELKADGSASIQVKEINAENIDVQAESGGKVNALAGKVIFADLASNTGGEVNFDGVAIATGSKNSEVYGKVQF